MSSLKKSDEEVETLDELSAKLNEQTARRRKSTKQKAHIRDEVVEKAAANAEMEIPEAMIDTELDRMVREFGQRLNQGMNLELYFQFSGQDDEN